MRRSWKTILCLAAVALLPPPTFAQESPSPDATERTALGAERKRLTEEAHEHHRNAEFVEGLRKLDRLLEIERKLFGGEHAQVAKTLEWMSRLEDGRGEVRAAARRLEEAQEMRRRVSASNDIYYALGQYNLAVLYAKLGEFQKAEEICLLELKKFKTEKQRETPYYANAIAILAGVYESLGEFDKATELNGEVRRIIGSWWGEESLRYAAVLNNLGVLKQRTGDAATAEPLLRRAVEIYARKAGTVHPEYATILGNLARLYVDLFDHDRARALHEEVLEIYRKACGGEDLGTAIALNNLACFCGDTGELERAEKLCRQAYEIRRERLGAENPITASSMHNLATILQHRGAYGEARELCAAALTILEETVGKEHPDYAITLNSLAGVHRARGEFETAERLYLEALAIHERIVGPEAPDLALALHNLAALYDEMQRDPEAEPLAHRALGIRRKALDLAYSVQSERQQFEATRHFRTTLNFYLFLSATLPIPEHRTYSHVLAWKGAVHARQALARITRKAPEASHSLDEFASVSRRLATLSLSRPPPKQAPAIQRQITELSARREELERELARKSAAFRSAQSLKSRSPEEIQRSLPPGAVLVDLLEYQARGRHLVAFVIPPTGPIVRRYLGPSAPIAAAVEAWRRATETGDSAAAGARLKQLVWTPIAEHLTDAKTVLVSPDGALNRIPFAALPGGTPGSYLIEETPVAVLPVPQLLPGVLSRDEGSAPASRLLAVGNVEYGAPGHRTFGRLPATGGEIASIGSTFERYREQATVTLLEGEAATEAAVRAGAPGSRWLHLATHGFFAPPGLLSALSLNEKGRARHPGLLSGLALASANAPPEPEGDDGILTALEVAALDLTGVELAVLSACETGLGEVAGGEGVLGLQRAFQVSGARTTITSLWRVPDRATKLLMERFYENLWGKGLPKLEALREAQLWLLNSKVGDEEVLRGLGLSKVATSTDESGRLAPRYWAAFVLAGDWR